MKAITNHGYGSPDTLELQEVDKQVVEDDEVRVRVRAASVNPRDWHVMRGLPYIARPMMRKVRSDVLGSDVAGQVEAVGKDVTRFRPGDEVFADVVTGGFAEYTTVSEETLALKPATLTFEQAAAVPLAALTALQGLRDHGRIEPGQKVLIIGASGGVGTFAVQIAKWLGAHVTGVCATRNVDMVRSLGADHVIDFTREDFTQNGRSTTSSSSWRGRVRRRTAGVLLPATGRSCSAAETRAVAGSDQSIASSRRPSSRRS